MIHSKKINPDSLHLALVLAFMWLGPELLWNQQWHEPIEIGDMYLGSTLAYRRLYSHNNMYSRSGRYTRLKNLDPYLFNEVISLRDRSYFSSGTTAFRSDVVAYYSSVPASSQASTEDSSLDSDAELNREHHIDVESETTIEELTNRTPDSPGEAASSTSDQSLDDLINPNTLGLSPEDMDLIEILWKQDIDLGVSKDAFNVHESRGDDELTSASKEYQDQKAGSTTGYLGKKSESSLSNDTNDSGYVIDSETGEQVMSEPMSDEDTTVLDLEACDFDLEDLTNTLSQFEDNFNDLLDECKALQIESELPEELDDSDSLELVREDNFISAGVDASGDFDMGGDMYPSMEEYWQDISTTLPIANNGCMIPRQSRLYSETSDDHSGTSTSSEVTLRPAAATDVFPEVLLSDATFSQRIPEVANGFSYLPPMIGPTSLGCAVASSIATLTNDTDPVPEANTSNNTFGFDIQGILPLNQTAPQSVSENFLSELLFDDDIHLMDVAAASNAVSPHSQGASQSASLIRMFQADIDANDTSVSYGMGENKRAKLEDLTTVACTGKDYADNAYKLSSNQAVANCGFHESDPSANNLSYICPTVRANYTCVPHNHTYHLPHLQADVNLKPLSRDKARNVDYNMENKRDERKAKESALPISTHDIINLNIDEFNERLSKYELTEPQHTLIRDIRRRGKNKVAAQNCRKRKMDQINTLQQNITVLEDEMKHLEAEKARLLIKKRDIYEKYTQLCQLHGRPVSGQSHTVPQSTSTSMPPLPDSGASSLNHGVIYNQGVRIKRKPEKKS